MTTISSIPSGIAYSTSDSPGVQNATLNSVGVIGPSGDAYSTDDSPGAQSIELLRMKRATEFAEGKVVEESFEDTLKKAMKGLE